MKRAYRRWTCGLVAVVAALLAVCAAVVYIVDPCLYYRMPEDWDPVFFSERYQAAGLAKNVEADTVLMGTSMAANYRASQIADTFGTTGVRITIPDGYLSEFDQVMDVLFRSQDPQRVIFGLDVNILVRDESGLTEAMPAYLYNSNPLDDVKYLINKDNLYYSVYTLLANRWGQGETLDEGFTWDDTEWWNHMSALAGYDRPEPVEEQLSAEAYLEPAAANLDIMESWITAHPETEFDIFFPPYSILYWDKTIRLGQTEAVFAAMDLACERLLAHDNVKLYGFLMDGDIVLNLDNYCDHIHHSGQVCTQVLGMIAREEYRLTEKNADTMLAQWREFVVDYDYEKFWDESFWITWNAEHGAES